MTDLGQLPAKIHALATAVEKGRKDTVMDMALAAKDEFLKGPPRSGLPKSSSLKWGAGFDIKGGAKPTALVKYRGPVHWTNFGTKPHVITPKGFVGSRASRTAAGSAGRLSQAKVSRGATRALAFDGKVRRVAYHPGQKARPFWPKVKKQVADEAPKILEDNVGRNIRRAGFGR